MGSGRHGRHGWKHWRHHWRNHMQQQQQAQQEQSQQQKQQQQQHAHNINETIRNFMPHIANSIPMVYNQEQLKNVGEYLRQFLDPFGIDVSYYVDNLGGGANSANAAPTTTTNTSTTTTTTTSTSTEEKKKEEEADVEKKPASQQEDKTMETEPLIEKPVDSAIASGNYLVNFFNLKRFGLKIKLFFSLKQLPPQLHQLEKI